VVTIPRLVVAAPGSGHGKTTVATGLIAALRARGHTVSPHKVGPDYIDPSYHALAAGRPGRNLDPWLVGEERIAPLFLHGAAGADIAVIEGVMGLFDGQRGRGNFASTAHVAALLTAPVILVMDTSGMARSVAALARGFADFDPDIAVRGILLNRVGSERHAEMLREALADTGLPVLGAIHRQPQLHTPARHLGLIPAAERSADAQAAVQALGDTIIRSVDLDAVVRLARSAPDLPGNPWQPPTTDDHQPRPVIAVAGGPAFTFSYAETSELLHAAGADIAVFDPLVDEALPPQTAGLIVGGGFPQVHAAGLSANEPLRSDIAKRVAAGLPVLAECAGLLFLGRTLDGAPMCGVLDSDARMTDRLSLGYIEATTVTVSPYFHAGTRVHGHEFHRTTTTPPHGSAPAWHWQRPDGSPHQDGFVQGAVHASYLHLHWTAIPDLAHRFVTACRTAHRPDTVGAER